MPKSTISTGKTIIKKKKWFNITSPKLFEDQVIGECYLETPEQGIGKKLVISLMTITGDPQKQNITLKFEIKKVNDSTLLADLIGYYIIPSAIRKMMRRSKSKIEDSFVLKTSDNVNVRIKTIFITKARSKGSVYAALQKAGREFFAKNVVKYSFEELINEVASKKIQIGVSSTLKKIHPLGVCEIKQLYIEPEKKAKILTVETDSLKEEKSQEVET